jgi:capsular polysaccharide biosynthesis protein
MDSDNPELNVPASVILWRRKFYVLGASLATALVALVVCLAVGKTYQAAATILVSLPPATAGGVTSDSVTASSDLAGQYAQLATLRPTLMAAAKALGVPENDLSGEVSAGVIASQNLVAIKVTAGSATVAFQRANAVAQALVVGINHTNAGALQTYSKDITSALGSTNREVSRLRSGIARNAGRIAIVDADSTILSSLLVQKQQAQSEIAQEAANEPVVSVASKANSASQAEPKTLLYTLIALIAGLLVAAQLAVLYPASKSFRHPRPEAESPPDPTPVRKPSRPDTRTAAAADALSADATEER